MKYALIGCGRIAINHIKAVINNKLELVCLCDIDSSHIDTLINKTGLPTDIPKYTDYRQMVQEHPELELVAIATESGKHSEIALFLIKNHINVIVEKPIAMSIKDADEMIKAAEEAQIKLCVCHQNRFNLAVQELRKCVENDSFGKLSHGSINVRWNRNKDYYDQATWRGKWASDGGALMNQCIHGIDLLRWMMGDNVVEVYGATRQRYHNYLECEDIGMAVLKFENGSIGTIEGTVNIYPKNLEETLCVFGEKGTVKLGGTSCNSIETWMFDSNNIDNKAGLFEETSNVYGNGHTSLYLDMIKAIKENRKPYVDGYAGRNALEIVLAIYKSQLSGQPVKLPLEDFSSTDMVGYFDKDINR